MEKIKKRNELSIFEDFRLKQKIKVISHKAPDEKELKKLNIFYKINNENGIVSYWKNFKGNLERVNKYGELITHGDEGYDIDLEEEPNKNSLKKYDGSIRVLTNKYNIPISYWEKSDDGKLTEVNNKINKDSLNVEYEIKAWLRNKAIDYVSLEIRNMKKKAYEYSHEELKNMIEAEENKLIKKGGWKAIRVAAMTALGISWVPFL